MTSATTPPLGLQISSTTPGDAALTPDQKRFNTLIKQIEKLRQTLATWREFIPQFTRTHAQVIVPLVESYRSAQREWVFALDSVLNQSGWTKTERATLRELIAESARDLLADGSDDAELKTLFDTHSDVDFETEQQESRTNLQAMMETMTGVDLGNPEDIQSHEELLQRMQQALGAQAEQSAWASPGDAPPPARRKTAAQRRREAEAQQATQSVREIFRKLASALHPDRETDPAARENKTALMQKVNQAYAANDLLTLLELQLQVEQVDATPAGQVDAHRLKHYNKVLSDQVAELKNEILHIESGFRVEGLQQPGWNLTPKKLLSSIDQEAKHLRYRVTLITRNRRLLADKAATKQWLKQERQRLRYEDSLAGQVFFI